MDWTLEDNMVDGFFFCITLTSLRTGNTPSAQRGAEASDRVLRQPRCSSEGRSVGAVLMLGMKVWCLVGWPAHSAFHW